MASIELPVGVWLNVITHLLTCFDRLFDQPLDHLLKNKKRELYFCVRNIVNVCDLNYQEIYECNPFLVFDAVLSYADISFSEELSLSFQWALYIPNLSLNNYQNK